MIRKILFAVFLSSQLAILAQSEIDKKAIKLVEKSDEAIAERDFAKAQELLYSALERDSAYAKTYEKLFTILRILQKPDETHAIQLRYVKNVNERYQNNSVWQSLAAHEFTKGNYLNAQEYINQVKKPDSVLRHSIQFSLEQTSNPKELRVQELPGEVNRLQHQYLPVLTIDGETLIFTGLRNDQSDENIYISHFENNSWTPAEPISEVINSPYNEGACTISADGRTLIFTACEGRRGFGNCDLYICERIGDEWSPAKNLGAKINSRFWDSQPSLSADGKTLYFVSNRPGGMGGRDIWVSRFSENQWSVPENLGYPVNTRLDETTPFIYANSKQLFFSSNGHVGLGGFDLLKADLENGKWKNIKNIGAPINSFNDEVSLFITSTGDQAFFAKEEKANGKPISSRLVTYGTSTPITTPTSYLSGRVFDQISGKPIAASIELISIETNGKDYQTESDPKSGKYFMVLPSSQNFGVFVEAEGYLPYDLSLSTTPFATTDTLNIGLNPIQTGSKVILSNIYFDFDSDELKQGSEVELRRVANFLKKNQMKIEISGHTDNSGSESYNEDLSTRRAKRVFNYLVGVGISSKTMVYTGYGSKNPIASNDEEAGKRQNRRIEFKVITLTR